MDFYLLFLIFAFSKTEVIWVIISVAEGGLLSLTQQMNSFHQLGSPVKSQLNESASNLNPFASRPKESSICEENITTQSQSVNNPQPCELNLISNNFAHNFITNVHSSLLNQTNDNQQESIQKSNLHSKHQCSLTTSDSKISKANDHLPPTPPPSEDMML